jgi:membrane-associated phospholipid phosphatase
MSPVRIKPFLSSFAVFWLVGCIVWFQLEKGDELFLMKEARTDLLDLLMPWITRLSEEVVYVPIIILFLFIDRLGALMLAIGGILSTILSSLLKGFFEMPRPRIWLSARNQLEGFDTIALNHIHDGFTSFPSGHTLAAFVLATILAYLRPKYQLLFLIGAVLVGFSRIYLVQHFLEDILFGSILGVMIGVLVDRVFSDAHVEWRKPLL